MDVVVIIHAVALFQEAYRNKPQGENNPLLQIALSLIVTLQMPPQVMTMMTIIANI